MGNFECATKHCHLMMHNMREAVSLDKLQCWAFAKSQARD